MLLGGIAALIGALALAAFFYFLIIGKPPIWKALGIGAVLSVVAAVRFRRLFRMSARHKRELSE